MKLVNIFGDYSLLHKSIPTEISKLIAKSEIIRNLYPKWQNLAFIRLPF